MCLPHALDTATHTQNYRGICLFMTAAGLQSQRICCSTQKNVVPFRKHLKYRILIFPVRTYVNLCFLEIIYFSDAIKRDLRACQGFGCFCFQGERFFRIWLFSGALVVLLWENLPVLKATGIYSILPAFMISFVLTFITSKLDTPKKEVLELFDETLETVV